MKKFFKEFKEFVSRGNVIDLAVGLIVGSAFTKIVNALTGSILMPLIGALTGGRDLKGLMIPLGDEVIEGGIHLQDAYGNYRYTSSIYYGEFLQAIIDFLLTAIVLFIIIKVINNIRNGAKKIAEEKAKTLDKNKESEPTRETILEATEMEVVVAKHTTEELLAKIVDLLEQQNNKKIGENDVK